jgi:hypothetical protein
MKMVLIVAVLALVSGIGSASAADGCGPGCHSTPAARVSSTVGAVRTLGTNVLQRPLPDLRVAAGMSSGHGCTRASRTDAEKRLL